MRRGTRGGLAALVIGLTALALVGAQSSASSSPQTIVLEPIGDFGDPTFVTAPPGDPDRLFVVEQSRLRSGSSSMVEQPTYLFLNAASWISCCGERGLLSMAFAPDYATSRRFYIYYTDLAGAIRVDEVLRDADDPNIADPSTRRQVIVIPHPGQSNHNGGQLQFGPDGMLYIGTGDGGGGGDPFRTGQNLGDRRGKILRIDPRENGRSSCRTRSRPTTRLRPGMRPRGRSGRSACATRGASRSTASRARSCSATWARTRGRRSTGGRSTWGGGEESTSAGAAWRGGTSTTTTVPSRRITPRRSSSTRTDGRCSITGGYIVRDPNIASMDGRYLYVDLCSGPIRSNIPTIPDAMDDRSEERERVSFPTSFGEDACGHLYVMGQGSGNNVFRINSTDPPLGTSARTRSRCRP